MGLRIRHGGIAIYPVNVAVAPVVATTERIRANGGIRRVRERHRLLRRAATPWSAKRDRRSCTFPAAHRSRRITKIGSYAGGTSGARSFGAAARPRPASSELHVHAHGVSNPDAFAKAAVAAIPRKIKQQTSKASPYSNFDMGYTERQDARSHDSITTFDSTTSFPRVRTPPPATLGVQ